MADKRNNRRNNKDYDDDFKVRKIRKKACPLCSDKNLVLDYKIQNNLKSLLMKEERFFQEEQQEHVQNIKEILQLQ